MDITNTIHDIIMGQVDDQLEPARVFADKEKDALRVRENALRVASENPPRTAYTAVDEYLGGIDPVAALKKRLAEGSEK